MAIVDEHQPSRFHDILSPYLPVNAVDAIVAYINKYSIWLKITRERRSKLGDYRHPSPSNPHHAISINGNINRYEFLLVMLHELAHLENYLRYGSSVKAHGTEWQQCYASLISNFLGHRCFPPDAEIMLETYIAHIPLSKDLDNKIYLTLHRYNFAPGDTPLILDDLNPGTRFKLVARPHLVFINIEKRRTRWRCMEPATGRIYTIHGCAEVIKL